MGFACEFRLLIMHGRIKKVRALFYVFFKNVLEVL